MEPWGISTVGRHWLTTASPQTRRNGDSDLVTDFLSLGVLAKLVSRYIRIVEARGSTPLHSTKNRLKLLYVNKFGRFLV